MTIDLLQAPDVVGLTKTIPLSRRGFMSASAAAAAAGFTLAAGPVRADVIKTDTTGIDAGDVKVKVADGDMPAYVARPSGVANPPVIIVAMEIFGLHEYIKDVTRMLAKLFDDLARPSASWPGQGAVGARSPGHPRHFRCT